MINRQNWLDLRDYLRHLEKHLGRNPKTVLKVRTSMRHVLEWAGPIPFGRANQLEPVLPAYLTTARNDGRAVALSFSTVYKILTITRRFYAYATMMWSSRYKLPPGWLDTLVPHGKPEPSLDDHRFYTLDEVRAIAAVSTATLREERGKVGACMLFLSGMRPDALASIPLQCVDLPNRRLLQIPSMGIRTKNGKAAITYLLDIADLFAVVQAWQQKVQHMAPTSLWYANLSRDGTRILEASHAFENRAKAIAQDIRLICDLAGVEYKSPHKLRHGHIVHARSLARNMEEVKAISQNVMHANSIITDQVYSALKTNQVQNVILNLGSSDTFDKAELLRLIEMLKAQLA